MTRLLKCYGEKCEQSNIKHPKGELTKYKSKNYCPNCLKEKKEEDGQRDKLMDYIKDEYGIAFVTPLMQKHINDMRKNGLTYKRIHALINYCLTIKQGFERPDMKYGLFIYSNYYEEMLNYYRDIKEKRLKNEGIEIKKATKVTKLIDSRKLKSNTYRDNKLFDMEE